MRRKRRGAEEERTERDNLAGRLVQEVFEDLNAMISQLRTQKIAAHPT